MTRYHNLDPDFQIMADSLADAMVLRIQDAQKRRDRKAVAKQLDGQYSLSRLLDAMRMNQVASDAPYEAAWSARIAERVGREPRPGFCFIPIDPSYRDLSAGTNTQLVYSNVGPGNTFVHYLDSLFPFERLGIRRLTLDRPGSFPGVSANVTVSSLANEAATISESSFTLRTASSTPKSLGAYIEVSGQLIKQTPALAWDFIMSALARGVAAELSRQMLVGTGSAGQVQGIFGGASVNVVSGGSANLAKMIDVVTTVEAANALLTPSSAAFVAAPTVSKLLRTRENAAGSGMIQVRDTAAGYPVVTTTATSPNTLLFGDFSQLLLLTYDALEISTDPYGVSSALFKTNIVGVRCWYMVDVILLNGPSFAVTGTLN